MGEQFCVKAFGDATQVIVDVMGYDRGAGVSTPVVTRVAGTPVSVSWLSNGTVQIYNSQNSGSVSVTAYSRCLDAPIKVS